VLVPVRQVRAYAAILYAIMGKNKDIIMNADEEAEETRRGKGEAELAPEPTHAGTRRKRKAVPPKGPTHRGNVGGPRETLSCKRRA
jgi:hypothetical protein